MVLCCGAHAARRKESKKSSHDGERTVAIGASHGKVAGAHFPVNTITTSKYSWYSFLPLVTLEQFLDQSWARFYMLRVT